MSYRNEMREVRKEANWTFWSFLPLFTVVVIVVAVIGFGLNSMGMLGKTIVEREVFENSYQYTAGQKAKIATLEATLASIDSQLMNGTLDADTRANLEAQKRSINIQLTTARKLSQ